MPLYIGPDHYNFIQTARIWRAGPWAASANSVKTRRNARDCVIGAGLAMGESGVIEESYSRIGTNPLCGR